MFKHLLCFTSLLFATVLVAQVEPLKEAPKYRLKTDVSHSTIPMPFASGSNLPLDRAYGRFTPEEKALLRAEYEHMPNADEPPFPEHGLGSVMKAMSYLHGKMRLKGYVDILVTVDAQGRGAEVALHKYDDLETAKAAALVLVRTQYKPGQCDGKPCVMQWRFATRFVERLN